MDDPQSVAFAQAANETRRKRTMLDFALLYANEGLRVLPLHSLRSPNCCSCGLPDCRSVAKHPITRSGVKDATCDRALIAEWWRLYPDANIGIAYHLNNLGREKWSSSDMDGVVKCRERDQ